MNWKILESVRGLIAVPASWRKWMGEDFEAFNILCLQPAPYIVRSFPCPIECGCWHEVFQEHGGAPLPSDGRGTKGEGPITATCRCDPPTCPELTLTLADITSVQ